MTRPSAIFLYLFLFLVPCGNAQYVVRQWNIEEGLPQSSVRCITQTHDGYLWVGTWNGLARFDGVHMTVFNALNAPILHPSIIDIYEDRHLRLWIGTDGGGLLQYRDNTFVRFDSTDGIDATMINSIKEDASGLVWFGTDNGIFVLTGNRFLHFASSNGFPTRLATEILPCADGSMYVQFVNTVFHVRLANDSLIFIGKPFSTGGYRIDMDSSGALWYGFKGKGLVKRAGSVEVTDKRLADVHPKEIFIPRNQQRWVMTPHGAYVLEGDRIQHLQVIDGIDCSSISSVFEDREGILWVASEGAGLLRLRKKQVQTFTTKEGLETNEIMCGMEDRSGAVWVGTWLGGLSRMNVGKDRFTPVPPLTNGISVIALCQSLDGSIWVGTWAHGVYVIRNGRVTSFLGKGLHDDTSIRAIVSDPGGGVWISTVYGTIGHYVGDKAEVWDSHNGLPVSLFNSLLLMRNGDVWAGTDGGGVVRISKGTVSILNTRNGLLDDFAHVNIEDRNGAVWLTSKRGLQRWKNGVLATLSPKHGFDDDPAEFIQDDDGNYWIGGTHGIHRMLQQELNQAIEDTLTTLTYLSVGKADGMPIDECAGGSNQHVWKTRDGSLWFSTTHGLVRLDPLSVASNPIPPGVFIEEVQIEHKPVPLENEIVVQPEQTKIEFHYTGINFAAPERIRFRYRLEGFDEWRDVGNERFAQYTNLDPGEYVFRVKAANNAGIWNDAGTSVVVRVLPPFWATWWFRGIILAFFLTIGPAIYIVRVRQLKGDKERQFQFSRRLIQAQETERQRIANELHDSLGQNLLVLKNRILVAQQDNGAASSLGEMSSLVSQTIEEVRSISHNLRPHQLDQLGVTKTIRALAKRVGETSGMTFAVDVDDIDALLKEDEDIGLFRIIQESLNNIIKHSGARQVGLSVKKTPDGIDILVSDNGKGMDVSFEQTKEEMGKGFGLSGMKERARMFGWGMEMKSETEKGTTIGIRIPFKGRTA